MSSESTNEDGLETREVQLIDWIPTVLPALKMRWLDHVSDLSTDDPLPSLRNWLTLLHVAATVPQNISQQLSQLFNTSKRGADPQNKLVRLTDLFVLTFQAAQAVADQLDTNAWQSLIEIQNRILENAVASASPMTADQRATLSSLHQPLYSQTVSDLNAKIVTIWDPNELLDEVVALIQMNFGFEYVSLFFVNQGEQTFTLQSAIWKDQRPKLEDYGKLDIGSWSILDRMIATDRCMIINDIANEAGYSSHPLVPEVKAQLIVPLMTGQKLVGILDIGRSTANSFTEKDRQTIQEFAEQVVVAIEKAKLQTALQRHLREKMLLYESNTTLGTNLDLDLVLKLMSQKIAEALNAGACVICQVDETANTITPLAEFVFRHPGNPSRTWRKLNEALDISKDPIGKHALRTAGPVIGRANGKKSFQHLKWSLQSPDGNSGNGWGVVLALPLEAEGRIFGLTEIYDRNINREFSADDLQLCRILTTQTTLAIERARLFDETRQRLSEVSTLYTLAQEISGNLDLQAVLNNIVVALRQATGCRGCCIFLLDQNRQQLEIRAADGLKPHWREMAKLRLGEGIAGRAAAEGRTIYLADTHQDPDFIFFDEEVRSLLVIPLFAHGEIIGTINLDDNRPDAFGPTQERLLSIAAAQAGIVIENARLFAKVSAEQQQTRAIIQHMADGILLIDSQGTIITCNQTLANMLDLYPNEIIGQNIRSPELPPTLARITVATTHFARTGVLATEVTVSAPRPRTLQVYSTTVTDDDKSSVGEVRVVHDITRERELEQLKDNFVSTISHELRTPLFSIHGFAQLLLEEDLEPQTRTEFLSTIQRQAAQLSEMVDNLLDLSRFDEGKLEFEREPVAIIELVQQTILKLKGFAHQRKVHLTSQLPSSLPSIIGDGQRLGQVLINLIGNAIKFTDVDGQVAVSASASEREILIEVKDTGIGIPPEALDQIFSRYYQVENNSERSAMGSGLGLHIAQKIVEGHGGRIWAESEAGQGSTFRFALPIQTNLPNNS